MVIDQQRKTMVVTFGIVILVCISATTLVHGAPMENTAVGQGLCADKQLYTIVSKLKDNVLTAESYGVIAWDQSDDEFMDKQLWCLVPNEAKNGGYYIASNDITSFDTPVVLDIYSNHPGAGGPVIAWQQKLGKNARNQLWDIHSKDDSLVEIQTHMQTHFVITAFSDGAINMHPVGIEGMVDDLIQQKFVLVKVNRD